MTGERFGRLVVIGTEKRGGFANVCCDCGSTKRVQSSHLRTGAVVSCGCYNREVVRSHRRAFSARKKAEADDRVRLGLKACSNAKCREQNPQPIGNFCIARAALDGRFQFCRTCQADKNLQQKFGITVADKLAAMASQGNRCASCRDEFESHSKAHVDHDHATGALRSILCGECNRALGLLRDSPRRIRALLAYAEKYRQLKTGRVA